MSSHSKLKKSEIALSNSEMSKWCLVNIHNLFKFDELTFVIDDKVDDYKVYNKAGEVDDYTNEAKMEKILAVKHSDGSFKFYNQNYDHVEDVYMEIDDKTFL